ncbi:MAG: hypothetical protein JRN39_00630 [Nitrososphaerota archaeon]|nr:hypothetical protein [Nitrososphaerota archaeon]
MVRQRLVHGGREGRPEVRIVQAMKSVGPRNVSLISRMTGVPAETVRYKIKNQFRQLGIRVHAEVDFRRLGLVPHWATLKFRLGYSPERIWNLFDRLHEAGYLTYYGRMLPQGYYAALLALPKGADYEEFLRYLAGRRVLSEFSLDEVVSSRHYSMNPRYFNFDSGRWELDWERLEREEPARTEARPAKEAGIDTYDLLLVKELQKDAMQRVADIGSRLGLSGAVLRYHMQSHVEGLIARYVIRWMKDIESTRAHSVLFTRLTVRGLKEQHAARAALSKLPFMWAEDILKDGTYISTLCVPVEEAETTFDYVHRHLPSFDEIEIGFLKPRDAYLYTIPYQMFTAGGWRFDIDALKRGALSSLGLDR